ncbi:GNAT family N-acetyltransferase [Pseudoalteromonas luteoviolacea]|uniref:N-acetyltransferase domain-containing protein n=1 Tax=Pseudoalteromonas luteoviolacea S4054 TaxID=1129367 RepID=A0A0F6ABW3_9GAMM|nr:GNAT family N-acetyltransferase [Pseudoalteromonas luteoviolacea]AOT10828.1 hypothetical protein S4054249_23560 [Pseudoalteromonas luteoviolacea]AOT16009.1 hypothetical protein S40542_24950 [Pseudoalteromonas luteoviolacea]AOT20650.1 hypothetical protein S4054_23480 [Pseudoalteromonas luteoviolacea]KKE82874.1 hypothetical protein N479_16510 [Pseudoalteromonas luteoviolacea S4054]KZN75245.1 hypothetical protein N481_07975 [Pseudoalteromonas luteoviolacea S4047-1]
MNITLKRALESDKPYLLALREETMTEHLERLGIFLCHEAHLSRLEEYYHYANLVFIDENKVGCLRYRATVHHLEIMQLQIAPEYQNKGIGTAVLRFILNRYPTIPAHLSVLKENPAQRLYHKLGFQTYSEDEFEDYMILKRI